MTLKEQVAGINLIGRLRYRNQFVLGSHYIEKLIGWKRTPIADSLFLTSHPDLNVIQASCEGKTITLIGFLLDPYNPSAKDEDIFEGMIRNFNDFDQFLDQTKRFGGRWIIIIRNSKGIRLFTDPAGLRQVFYTDIGKTNDLWCASQPRLIVDILNLEMCQDGIEHINSYEFRKNPEFRWPGDATPYEEILHLLPNHSLDLTTGSSARYWPKDPLENGPMNASIEKCCSLLKGLMIGASHRFELALGITAGIDSRIVLAASKGLNNVYSYFTVQQIGMAENHADIEIPSHLLSKVGLLHDVIQSSLIMDNVFFDIFRDNTALAHPVYAPDAYAILKHYAGKYGKEFVVVTGSASEIARSSFREQLKKSAGEPIIPGDLAKLQSMKNMNYVLNSFERWIDGIQNSHGYDILDIFEWEQGHGNWLAMCQLEFNIAWKDIFTPFNCRELLETMLSVDCRYRKKPDYDLFHAIVLKLWPELLDFQINPHKNHSSPRTENEHLFREYAYFHKKFGKKLMNRMKGIFTRPFIDNKYAT